MGGSPATNVMALWAKHGNRSGYHPLIYHLVDVAAVALALWDTVLTRPIRERVGSSLGLSEAEARLWVAFLAGTHDLGKASVAFSRQVDSARGRLDAAGLIGSAPSSDAPHGSVTTIELPALLSGLGVPPTAALPLAASVGAHHGSFQHPGSLTRIPPGAVGSGPWSEARRELVDILASLIDLPRDTPAGIDTPTAMWLAGFVSVVDWIGSDERFFGWASPDGAVPVLDVKYLRRAEGNASRALRELGWQAQPAPADERSFSDLFHYPPNSMQTAVMALQPAEQGLVIIEAPTGFGKTEAALWLTDAWSRRLGTRGFYVALPTQATSNQMFGRVESYLRRRYPGQDVNLQLLHGHASLSSEFETLRSRGLYRPTAIYGDTGDVLAAEWFTYRKRGLLAPYGVGTVDQVLLAVLQTRHMFVRLFGLAGKTVILDEVHAYDTYMSTLLDRLLAWLAALGSPVVLLSATLPDSRRRALARAYASGMGRRLDQLAPAPYPRLTWVGITTDPETVPLQPPPEREIALRWVDGSLDNGFRLGEALRSALADGGVAAVVCNSVDRAQRVYLALRRYFPPEELDLLHARYLFEERAARERRTLHRFAKEGDRPQRAVLVATQIVEQSLDLDFDLLVTDLAPIDLLLQRIGRLHRHHRPDRPITAPEAWVCRPESATEGIPSFGYVSESIYDPAILLRTWISLQDRAAIRIPSDVQPLIEAVYDDVGLPALDAQILRRLEEVEEERHKAIAADELQARGREIRAPSFRGHLAKVASDPRAEDAPELHPEHQALTRLTEPSVPVVFLEAGPSGALLLGDTHVDTASAPSDALARRLLERSVPISSRRVVYDLLDQPVPPGWRRHPLLRHHRAVVLPRDGPAHIGSAALELDDELGILINRWKGER